MTFDPSNTNQFKDIINNDVPSLWMKKVLWGAEHKDELKKFYKWVEDYSNYINQLYKRYQESSNESEQFELASTINSLQKNLEESGYLDLINEYVSSYNYGGKSAGLETEYNKAVDAINLARKINKEVRSDIETNVVNSDKSSANAIHVEVDAAGNPVIKGRVAYTKDDLNLSAEELNNAVTQRINDALASFFNDSNFTTAQKVEALSNYLGENPSYSFSNSNLTKVVKLRDNVFSAINKIATSTLTNEEKQQAIENLANDYSNQLATVTDSPIKFSDMWNDLGINKDLSDMGMLQLAVDTTIDGDELAKAINMYISNKSIYDSAIKSYEDAVKSYSPENIEKMGNEYGDIESKYNAQKVDNQVTNTAKGMGQSDVIANQLGNSAQYQNYAENLADNQMKQMENAQNFAQNDLDNQYTQVQNAYNNAVEAENAMMGENDKNNAAIQAALTQQGVDMATDKYNYERANNKVQLATSGANALVNGANTIKNAYSNRGK